MIDQESILRLTDCIFVKRNFQFVKIRLDEILYMEAAGNYVHIVAGDKKFTVRLSLIQAVEKIHYPKLVRINRSVVVNVDAIQSFNKEQVMVGQREISIGKNHRGPFFRQLGLGPFPPQATDTNLST
jgi:DNA-binding LytR/AlgR family response regulator